MVKFIEFLRVPDNEQNMDLLFWNLVSRFIATSFVLAVPFFLFFPPRVSILAGLFVSFLLMAGAEGFGRRRRFYFLSKYRIVFARILFIPFIGFTALMYFGPFAGRDGMQGWDWIFFVMALSILSLLALLTAVRQSQPKKG